MANRVPYLEQKAKEMKGRLHELDLDKELKSYQPSEVAYITYVLLGLLGIREEADFIGDLDKRLRGSVVTGQRCTRCDGPQHEGACP